MAHRSLRAARTVASINSRLDIEAGRIVVIALDITAFFNRPKYDDVRDRRSDRGAKRSRTRSAQVEGDGAGCRHPDADYRSNPGLTNSIA